MPSTRKKLPASAAKKKTLASTKSKSSVKKSTKKNRATTKNDGLYLQVAMTHASSQEAISTVSNSTIQEQRQEEFSTSTGQAIMQVLHKLDASNQAFTKRMDSFERQNSISSTPLSSPTAQHPGAIHPAHAQQGRIDLSTNQVGTITTQAIPVVQAGIPDHMSMTSVPCDQAGSGRVRVQTQVSRDVVPKLDAIRSIPSVSSAVSRLLAQYDDQADQEALPGKISNARKKSGHYNITDTSIVSPQYRWPNAGLVSNSHIKKPSYDELNMAQWASGQLNNMLLVEDNTTLRCMLTQMSMAMRDAGSLPWSAVRSAWAVSMTDIEEGKQDQ